MESRVICVSYNLVIKTFVKLLSITTTIYKRFFFCFIQFFKHFYLLNILWLSNILKNKIKIDNTQKYILTILIEIL